MKLTRTEILERVAKCAQAVYDQPNGSTFQELGDALVYLQVHDYHARELRDDISTLFSARRTKSAYAVIMAKPQVLDELTHVRPHQTV